MEHTKHIWRAVFIILLVPVAFIVVSHIAIPSSFGLYGHYRADSVKEFMAKPAIHGGDTSCFPCHEKAHKELLEKKAKGKHATVPCENCHNVLSSHVKPEPKTGDLQRFEKMAINKSIKLCGYCHEYLEARPKSFPQVILREHVKKQDAEFEEGVCIVCHDPHTPSLKEEVNKDGK